jgi:hypothetical protein
MKLPRRFVVLGIWALLGIGGATALAEEPQGRPGVIRMGDLCFQPTDTYGDFRDAGRQIPCDDRYKESEEIAGWEFTLKTNLKVENSPGHRAAWEAWQASAASGATTWVGRLEAYTAETRKQAEQHADAKPYLHGTCQPNDESEQSNKEVLERGCKGAERVFQRDYWLALQGDHQAQESIARCFQDDTPRATDLGFRWPCHRVVWADETVMCAWYLVAASSGHPKSADSAEKYGYVYECDKKTMYERQAILGTASELFLRIYHRPIPVAR